MQAAGKPSEVRNEKALVLARDLVLTTVIVMMQIFLITIMTDMLEMVWKRG